MEGGNVAVEIAARYPGVSSWEALEHIGPTSRTVADSALMLSVITGPDDRDNRSLPSLRDATTGARSGVQPRRTAAVTAGPALDLQPLL